MSSNPPDPAGLENDGKTRARRLAGMVTAVEPQLHDPARVSVFVEGVYATGLPAELAEKLDIRPGRVLTGVELQGVEAEDRFARAMDAALRFVAHEPRTSEEVRRRLLRMGMDEALISRVLERLSEDRVVDDKRYIRAYLESRIRNQGYGPRRVQAELLRRGLPREAVEAAMETSFDEESTLFAALEQARRRWGRLYREGDSRKTRGRLFEFLVRRGFSTDVAREAVRRVSGSADEAE